MRDPYQIIERPLLTEKSMDLSHSGKYTFRVVDDANKIEIAEAIEKMYKVKVTKVNTMTVRGKMTNRGFRMRQKGKTSDWKKAIVTLAPGQTITLFEGL